MFSELSKHFIYPKDHAGIINPLSIWFLLISFQFFFFPLIWKPAGEPAGDVYDSEHFIYGVYSVKALPNASCWQRPSKRREGGWAGKRCSSEMMG